MVSQGKQARHVTCELDVVRGNRINGHPHGRRRCQVIGRTYSCNGDPKQISHRSCSHLAYNSAGVKRLIGSTLLEGGRGRTFGLLAGGCMVVVVVGMGGRGEGRENG